MIYHVYSDYTPADPNALRCIALAKQTWARQSWMEIPVADDSMPRLWRERGKALPYVRDVLDRAAEGKLVDDIIVYTNLDIQVRGDAAFRIFLALGQAEACYGYRRDFPPRLTVPVPDKDYPTGHDYCGCDLFAFKAGWWFRCRQAMPDMILGIEFWDACMRVLIEGTNPGQVVCVRDIIAHEKDGNSWWEKPENRYTLQAQLHNLRQGCRFMRGCNLDPTSFGVPPHIVRGLS